MKISNRFVCSSRNRRASARTALVHALCAALVAGLSFAGAAGAGFLVVPNGDFSAGANAGTVGGGVIGASGTNVPIGSGPWTGTYNGVLGLLAPPSLQITVSGTATISGLLGINAVGIVNNGGHFGQTLASSTQSNKRYTLIANLSTDALLDLPLLATAGTGIALLAGASPLASSTTAPAAQVRADAVDATTLRIQLHHDTGVVTPAALGIQLFDRPQALLTAALIDTATFSGVQLAESTIPPAGNTTLTVSGGGSQSTGIGQPFPSAMTAVVRDQDGNPVPDTLVTLTAPAEGASATLQAGSESGRVIVTFTDANGQITLNAQANGISGCYTVTGEVTGVATTAVFRLRNYTPQQIEAYMAAHPGTKGMPQDSVFCNGFE